MDNLEDTFTISVIGNGIGGSAGVIQSLISDAYALNPSIAAGLPLAKITVLAVGADAFSVAIAVQSGDPDRIGRASTAAIGSILLSTFGAIGAGLIGVTGVLPVLAVAGLGGLGTFLGKQFWEHYKESFSTGIAPPPNFVVPDGISGSDYWSIPGGITPGVSNQCNRDYRTSVATRAPVPRDPLAIDLDGDGIETVGITATPVLFDHNADNIKTGTGWVRPDDAWLVLDRNGNGTIDSGRELFGVDTVLSGTPGLDAVYASTGFEALRTLDTNNDNLFNAADAAFAQVQIWQDVNQDGISQASELFTLAQKNIASIALNASITDTTAANLFLGVNPFYREFTTPVTLTVQAQGLPKMQGSGWVRDLREAMSRGQAIKAKKRGKLRRKTGVSPRGICVSSYENSSKCC